MRTQRALVDPVAKSELRIGKTGADRFLAHVSSVVAGSKSMQITMHTIIGSLKGRRNARSASVLRFNATITLKHETILEMQARSPTILARILPDHKPAIQDRFPLNSTHCTRLRGKMVLTHCRKHELI